MRIYNKLVRDRIPEIIEGLDKKCKTVVLNEDRYVLELTKKLIEEVQEYMEAKNIEELADILEVVFALTAVQGFTEGELMATRDRKREERGGFEERIFLESVEGEEN